MQNQGKPLHELAHEQKNEPEALEKIVQQKTRQVQIYKIELLDIALQFFTFKDHV
jgi:tRNA U55 pseudouridine synthase TruB